MNKEEQIKYINEATKHIIKLFSKSNTNMFLPHNKTNSLDKKNKTLQN